jgi:hypothetical protein
MPCGLDILHIVGVALRVDRYQVLLLKWSTHAAFKNRHKVAMHRQHMEAPQEACTCANGQTFAHARQNLANGVGFAHIHASDLALHRRQGKKYSPSQAILTKQDIVLVCAVLRGRALLASTARLKMQML